MFGFVDRINVLFLKKEKIPIELKGDSKNPYNAQLKLLSLFAYIFVSFQLNATMLQVGLAK